MGGFTLAGNIHVFVSKITEMCMCDGLYGFIDKSDEEILLTNKSLDIANIMDTLSVELQEYLQLLLKSHTNTNTCYTISRRDRFIVPSYWNPNKKLYI
jgi:hypothetical protein